MFEELMLTDEAQSSIVNLYKLHPQIEQKALFDHINGLEVVNDHLKFRSKANDKFFSRIWGIFTGQESERQQRIDENLSISLSTITAWIQGIQIDKAESDIIISTLSDKLIETRERIIHIQNIQTNVLEQLSDFHLNFEHQLSKLQSKISDVDLAQLANSHLEQVFDKWKAGRLDQYPPLVRLFLVVDELYWGKFGEFCRKLHGEKKSEILQEQLIDKALVQIKQDISGNTYKLFITKEWLYPIQSLPDDTRQTIAYLSNWSNPQKTPITWAIRNAALPQDHFPRPRNRVPHVISCSQAVKHLTHESRNRY